MKKERKRTSIVEQLVAARKEQGIKAKELARRLGVTAACVSQMESGKYKPLASTIERVAEALDRRIVVVPAHTSDEEVRQTNLE